MKPPAPKAIRKGAVVRIAGDPDDSRAAASAYAISFADVRYADTHVERWLGTGELRDDPSEPVSYSELVDWATDVALEHSLSGDLAMYFSNVDRQALQDAPIEIVFEWHAQLPRLD
jgi:hypothetical protein